MVTLQFRPISRHRRLLENRYPRLFVLLDDVAPIDDEHDLWRGMFSPERETYASTVRADQNQVSASGNFRNTLVAAKKSSA